MEGLGKLFHTGKLLPCNILFLQNGTPLSKIAPFFYLKDKSQ